MPSLTPTGRCLDPDLASGYAAHALDEHETEAVARHIDSCASCRVLVSAIAGSARSSDGQGLEGEPLLRAGAKLGPYEVLGAFEAGGMGVIYRAHDARLDRLVALKAVRTDAGDRAQLLREARLMARLSHPNVVPVYDVVEAGELYVAMEFVAGQSLRQWLSAAPHGWQEVVDVFLAAGEGLAAAHAAGIVHGDVKPSNLLLGDDGRVRVTDFGLGVLHAQPGSGEVLQGTPAYVAPELLAGAAPHPGSDQYAFCVSLHEALYRVLPGHPLPEGARSPAGVSRVLARGLSAAPEARFGSMRELLVALRSARARRWRLGLLAGLVLAVGSGSAWLASARSVEARLCEGATASLVSAWNAESRAQIEHSFHATGRAWADAVLGRVTSLLDGWNDRFESAKREACAPSLFGPRVPADQLEARLGCLAEAASAARGVVSQLRESDPATQLNAISVAEALTVDCAAVRRATSAPLVGPEVTRLRDDFARFNAMIRAGRARPALELAAELQQRADELHEPRFQVAALVSLGMARDRTSDGVGASKVLREAVQQADVVADDRLRAQAWVSLLQTEFRRGKHELVIDLADGALGAARHLGDPWLETEALLMIGGSLSARDQVERAKAMFERAVAVRRATFGPKDRRTAFAVSALGNALAMQSDLRGAAEAHREAIDAAEAALGHWHPSMSTLRGNLGDDELYGLKLSEAVTELGLAVEIARQNDPHSRDVANQLTDLGFAQLLQGEPALARVTFDEALPLWETLAPDHPQRAMALLGSAQTARALGQPVNVAELEKALKLASAGLPPFERGRVQAALAEALPASEAVRAKALMKDAVTGLGSARLPLLEQELDRARAWQERHE